MADLRESGSGVRIAIEGCGHGTLHAIYASVAEACKRQGWEGVDLLIICGDFQAVRNAYDLNCVNMPAKYRHMGDFHEYYSGQREAPYLTVFVGGNHEASNHLFELYYGGWVAPNIYYLGAANVVRLGPLRIAGLSGIWKGYSYRKAHFERLPYNENDLRTVYDVRELDVRKLLQLRTQVDIGISHDWPNGVEWKGDWKQLFRFKGHLEPDARSGRLGSVAAKEVMEWLRPELWFSAHLHCKYAAVVEHEAEGQAGKQTMSKSEAAGASKNADEVDLDDDSPPAATNNADEIDLDLSDEAKPAPSTKQQNGTSASNQDEIDLDLDDDDDMPPPSKTQQTDETSTASAPSLDAARAALPESFRRPPPPEIATRPTAISNTTTNFLALDKCLPGRRFLQLQEIDSDEPITRPLQLQYDREWLSIIRSFAIDEPLTLGDPDFFVRRAHNHSDYVETIDKRRLWIDDNLSDADLVIPQNFEVTAPVYDGGDWNDAKYQQVREAPNLQTARFCKMLQIPNPFEISEEEIESRLRAGPKPDDNVHQNRRGRGGRGNQMRGNRGGRGRRGGRGGFPWSGRGRGGSSMAR